MKRTIQILLMLLCTALAATAQEHNGRNGKKMFSHQEFQEQQKTFITMHAKLTPEEADAFFPLFFELQKKKRELNKDLRNKSNPKHNATQSEEECAANVNKLAETRVKIAELEKEYTLLYLKVLPASKILNVQYAEEHFQREMLKGMCNRKDDRNRKEQKIRQ